jgi:hypothetical protein
MTTSNDAVRLAMWSGPRNLSTALMRSWENRPDTAVIDEPFYAHYLTMVDVDHPGKDEVIEKGETDWRKVVAHISGPVPDGKRIYYQKHMAHHFLPHMDHNWFPNFTHAFLIRDPKEMLLSLDAKVKRFGLRDTGLPQQIEIYEYVKREMGQEPAVIDSSDILKDPRKVLSGLCDRVGVAFDEHMLSWPSGPGENDGVWGKHWYASVEASTGFKPYTEKEVVLPDHLTALYETCKGYYDRLWNDRIH